MLQTTSQRYALSHHLFAPLQLLHVRAWQQHRAAELRPASFKTQNARLLLQLCLLLLLELIDSEQPAVANLEALTYKVWIWTDYCLAKSRNHAQHFLVYIAHNCFLVFKQHINHHYRAVLLNKYYVWLHTVYFRFYYSQQCLLLFYFLAEVY